MNSQAVFVAWQPVLTDHQAFTLQELARESGRKVIAFVMHLQDPARQAQGWKDTQVKSVERQLIPQRDTLRYCYRRLREHRHDMHFFASPFDQPKLMVTLFMAALLGVDFYLISEPYPPAKEGYFDADTTFASRIKSLIRPLVYRCYALLLRRQTSGIFAISSLAVEQYRRSGFPADKVFPFGYFVPQTVEKTELRAASGIGGQALRLIFVGNLIRRKGVDLLIAAVRRLRSEGRAVSLDAFGSGNPQSLDFDGISIRYCGLIPFGLAQGAISPYDLLVLPSRFDGWGVVVNEALSAGVPVVCSDGVGAKALVEKFGAGLIFLASDSLSLYSALKKLLDDPLQLADMRVGAGQAALAIEPRIAAEYMLCVIRAEGEAKLLVQSPWYGAPGAHP